MVDIGVLGLDTSHPEAFADVLNGLDTEYDDAPAITAVWDGGAVRDDAYVDSFCADVGATRYDDPAAMVGAVDAAMVLAVDWERHRQLARPFLKAGVPTLVDKPIAGTLADLEELADAAAGTPLFGGSAVPFHPEFVQLSESAADRTLHVAGYNDFFYYRAHTVDLARRIVCTDWASVAPQSRTETTTVEATFTDETVATLRFDGNADAATFGALDVADRTRAVAVTASEETHLRMYEGYLASFLDVVRGTDPDPTAGVLDAARLLLAVEAALADDREITPDDQALTDVGKSSDEFVADYEPYY